MRRLAWNWSRKIPRSSADIILIISHLEPPINTWLQRGARVAVGERVLLFTSLPILYLQLNGKYNRTDAYTTKRLLDCSVLELALVLSYQLWQRENNGIILTVDAVAGRRPNSFDGVKVATPWFRPLPPGPIRHRGIDSLSYNLPHLFWITIKLARVLFLVHVQAAGIPTGLPTFIQRF